MIRFFLPLALFCAQISGCAAIHDDNTTFGIPISQINLKPVNEAQRFVENRTVRTFDPGTQNCLPISAGKYTFMSCTPVPGHGTQIEYYAPDGRAYLWYPGNSRAVRSRWKLQRGNERYRLCSRYPSASYNPITREHGGNWQCENLGSYASRIREIRQSDIFGLETGSVPWPLEKADTTFDKLLARSK